MKIILLIFMVGLVLFLGGKMLARYIKIIIYTKRAEINDDSTAMNKLGNLYFKEENYGEAEKYYRMSAEKNNIDGLGMLGVIYFLKGKTEEAEEYIRQAIGGDSLFSMYNLGSLYEVIGNEEEAVEYYKMAAKKGYKQAIKRLKRLENKK